MLLSALALQAQMCPCEFGKTAGGKPLRFEAGLNMANARELLINFYSPDRIYSRQYVNGLMLKYHADRYSLRAGFDYTYQTYRFESGDQMNYNLNNGRTYGKHLRLGLEKTLTGKALQVYAGGDLLFTRERYSGISEGYGDWIWWGYKTPYRFRVNSAGISPFLGIRYRPLKRFSIAIESSLSLLYYSSKSFGDAGYRDEASTALTLNPVRLLSFNYHFAL